MVSKFYACWASCWKNELEIGVWIPLKIKSKLQSIVINDVGVSHLCFMHA